MKKARDLEVCEKKIVIQKNNWEKRKENFLNEIIDEKGKSENTL